MSVQELLAAVQAAPARRQVPMRLFADDQETRVVFTIAKQRHHPRLLELISQRYQLSHQRMSLTRAYADNIDHGTWLSADLMITLHTRIQTVENELRALDQELTGEEAA